MPKMDASPSSSQWKYDVFLSFRGEDTRNTFTAHLYEKLCSRGINTFIDDRKLRRGQAISPALVTAIESSMFSIVVLSQNYASSGWCLEELVKILESKICKTERVLPIFYNVDPFDIRKQKGQFGKAFNRLVKNPKGQKLERVKIGRLVKNLKDQRKVRVKIWRLVKGWKRDRVKIWRKALKQVANIAGWDSRNRHEPTLIKEIVVEVSNKLFSRYSSDDNNLVGIYSRMQEVQSQLCITSNDVGIVGICGMGGIGKTTLANAIYTRVSHQFESSAFLENVGEDFRIQGLIGLQQKLLSLLVDDGNLNIKGCTSIKGRLCSKKVLIVLDNVKDGAILEFLTANQDSFGPGSRIILTTREKDLLTSYSVKHYEVRKLKRDEAMEVLRPYSLKHELSEDDSMELCEGITNYAQGLPLALKVLGSSLFGMKKPEWRSHLDKLKSSPHPEINRVLQISYDELDNKVKNIFLDIACFFKGEHKDHVIEILEACGFFPDSGIRTLLDKSLITISYYYNLQMHDLIQDMGMEVVRGKCPNEPGNWSRLWSREDVSRVLKKNTGTEEVEGIFLNLSNLREINFTSEAFARMNKLRLLKVYRSHISEGFECAFEKEECKVHFSRNFKFHSDDLRYLYWHGYSLKSLPYNFNPENVVELNMRYSHIKQLWKGKKDLGKLKFMELSHSQFLVKTPDLSRATNLERLVLEGCTYLCAVDPSLADLKKLIFLSLRDCINLRHFPSSIELESLQILILSGCSKFRKFPEIRGHMKHLSELFLHGTTIKELPSSIEYATGLLVLDLTNCKELKSLPNSICNLESLETLLLSDCSKLESLPQNFGKLKGLRKLHADRTPLRGLPDSFVDLRFNLEEVSFCGCKGSPTSASWLLPWKRSYSLDFLFPPLSALRFLKDLTLRDCNIVDGMQLNTLTLLSSLENLDLSRNNFVRLPSSFSQLPQLRVLRLVNCRSLQALPELPSTIEEIDAHNCILLRKISNQPLNTGIRRDNFTNCFELIKDYESNAKSIFQTLDAQFRSRFNYNDIYVNRLVFSTLIPGSQIPEWFTYQKEGSEVFIEESPNWNNINFPGFALCAVLGLKDVIRVNGLSLGCCLGYDDHYGVDKGFPLMIHDSIPVAFYDELIESDHIWSGYVLAPSCKDWPPVPRVRISFDMIWSSQIIKSCGVRLLCPEDMSDNNATLIEYISAPPPSSVILEELDNLVAEDNEIKTSFDGGELSGSGLELENDDDYNTDEEDPSGSGCSNENFQSECTTDYSIDEGYPNESAFHHDLQESVSEDTISRRSQDEGEPIGNECSDMIHIPVLDPKHKREKNIERRSHLQWNATCAFGFIFFVGVGILGSFWMKGRTSERKMKIKERKREGKIKMT